MNYPTELIAILTHFSILFSAPVWNKGVLLVTGALLCPRQRTVASALRVTGRREQKNYCSYHRVLSRAKWSAFSAGRILLGLLIKTGLGVVPGYIIFALDETVERRQGKKIKAKGCYRDAVRSSESCVVKCFGLKWVCATVIILFPWSKRPWALPYLTVLAHSKKANESKGKRHRTCVDIAALMVQVTMRWLGVLGCSSQVIFLGDGGYAAVKFMWTCINTNATLICRFRLDASLYDWPEVQPKGKRGRKPKKGKRQRSLKAIAADPSTEWTSRTVAWYGGMMKEVEYVTGVSLWYRAGYDPVPLRWVIIRIPETGRVEALCSTDLNLSPDAIIGMFVLRWNIEVMFEEVRRHLGVETQRQWSDLAVERTTPCLFALFSITTLYGLRLWQVGKLHVQGAAWYKKKSITFSDVLSAARLDILEKMNYTDSEIEGDVANFTPEMVASLMRELASAA
jgi:hypothetical protein